MWKSTSLGSHFCGLKQVWWSSPSARTQVKATQPGVCVQDLWQSSVDHHHVGKCCGTQLQNLFQELATIHLAYWKKKTPKKDPNRFVWVCFWLLLSRLDSGTVSIPLGLSMSFPTPQMLSKQGGTCIQGWWRMKNDTPRHNGSALGMLDRFF
jgi:hypothetical protein